MSYTVRNLVIAAALAVVGMVLMGTYLKGERARIERGNTYVKVLIADKDIPAGTSVQSMQSGDYVRLERVLREDAQPQALRTLSDVKGLSVSRTVFTGDQVTARSFEKNSGLKLADQIRGTERQLAIPVGAFQSVANNLKPGDRVDVWASTTGGDNGVVTWVAARNVEIVETPASRRPEGEEVASEPVDAGAEPQLYTVQVTDRVAMDLIASFSAANEVKFYMGLRPGDGAQETKLKPMVGVPNNT